MKMVKFVKAAVALSIVAACGIVLAACSGSGESKTDGAVAATVNGVEIPESKVTETVENYRAQMSLDDEESWANFLIQSDMTPQSLRENIIDSLVDSELLKSGAASLDITVDESEIDTYVDKMKANYGDDDAWQSALKQAGFTEDEYRDTIKDSLIQQKISEYFSDKAEVSDDKLVETAQTYATYYDGAKRSSHILFGVDDTSDEAAMKKARQSAKKVLEKIKSGELDFADAAKEYSTDGSASNGGDVGWDMLNSFVTEYTDALGKLGKDEVSDLVKSQYGIHIIKCTDVFNAPEKITKLSQLPEAFQDSITEMAKSMKASEDQDKWLEEQHEAAEIVINDMPEDASYNVDLSKYQTDEASDESADGDEEEATADGEDEDVQTIEVDEDVEAVDGDGDSGDGDKEVEVIEVEEEEASGEASSDESEKKAA